MPLIQRKGAQSSQGFGEFAQSTAATYIEDVFSTYLYTGNAANRTITNGIDLSTKGGLVWIKSRSNAISHVLEDTARGPGRLLSSDLTAAQVYTVDTQKTVTAFNTDGFSLGTDSGNWGTNFNAYTYVSWTFRKQAKFFDIVTYTGNGGTLVVSHALASTPGCVFVKRINSASDWVVGHRGSGSYWASQTLRLNTTAAGVINGEFSAMSNTTVTVVNSGVGYGDVNTSGATYVMYLFAHNAGGFGSDGTQNVISCGSYTGNGSNSGPIITLGYEPQWVMIKCTNAIGNWWMMDTMRGMSQTDSLDLQANASTGDLTDGLSYARPLATGFSPGINYAGVNASGSTYIYIAIRRGPMKTPTVGTSVFAPVTRAGTGTTATVTSTVSPVDMLFSTNQDRVASSVNSFWDRLRGGGVYLNSNVTNAEASNASVSGFDVQNGVTMQGGLITNGNSYPYVNYNFQRAPGFFDEVCYTGTGSVTTFNHNLGVVPEMMIVKDRTTVGNWTVYSGPNGATGALFINATNAFFTSSSYWNNTAPTSTVFTVAGSTTTNVSGDNFVVYLFASCPGVSKVGSYTGTGATQTINCGFTGGARFVLIKRTDSTGDWYVWDTARGMVAGTDPYLLLDSTAAEVNANNVYTTGVGFQIVGTGAGINASGGTYLYLAVA